MQWWQEAVQRTRDSFEPLADPQRAPAMAAYMKQVAPYLGISTPARRRAQRAAWEGLTTPAPEQVLRAAAALAGLAEREYHYAAIELLGRHLPSIDPSALAEPIRELVVLRPWWDTVDMFGSAVINPLVARHPELVAVMWDWNRSDDPWLVRASIQHQRGRGAQTDSDRVIAMCAPHAADRRFFVAKAVGWALRDLTRIDPVSVRGFLADHPDLPAVSRREAERGLARVG